MAFGHNQATNKIKFNLKMGSELKEKQYIDIEKWRVILYKMNFLGEYETEKVSFGNLSKRNTNTSSEFIITGAHTGKYPNLSAAQYTKVLKCDPGKMSIDAIGPIAPSEESLTHYSIYSNCAQVNSIFHVHHEDLWNYLRKGSNSQIKSKDEQKLELIAEEAQKLVADNSQGIFAIPSLKNEIISYGSNVEEAGQVLLNTLKESRN